LMEALAYRRARIEGKEIGGFHHIACGCGCGPFPSVIPKSNVQPLPKQPKRQRQKADKSKYHPTAKSAFGKVLND
jgi:hypothetical protein